MKKIASILLAMVLFVAMTLPVMAASITITPAENDTADHTFQAYQIFTGDLKTDVVTNNDGTTKNEYTLSNVKWGDGVNGTTLFKELITLPEYEGCADEAAIAEKLPGLSAAKVDEFAQIVSKHLKGDPAEFKQNEPKTVDPGYYFVRDKAESLDGKTAAYTRYILKVVGEETVQAKAEVPGVEKKIVEGEDKVNVNEASIGDEITFEVTSAVPDMTGFEKYFFIVNDTMSEGLTFDPTTVEIKIQDYTGNIPYHIIYKEDDSSYFGIVFESFIQYKALKGKAITVRYKATLNEAAVIAGPNPNTVDLTYSNNPNVKDNGTPEKPDEPTGPTGKTPESKTETYTTELTVLKKDETKKSLTGAEFQLIGEGAKQVIVTTEEFTEDSEGSYWKLIDGTYTDVDPNTGGMDQTKYESLTTKYKTTTTTTVLGENKKTDVKAFVGNDGKVTFTGLGAGTYTLKETTTPPGYNTIQDITFTIGFDAATKTFTSDNDKVKVETDNKLSAEIVNQKGSELPSTGGIGTTIFYVIGSILMIAAGVVLVSKRRMRSH